MNSWKKEDLDRENWLGEINQGLYDLANQAVKEVGRPEPAPHLFDSALYLKPPEVFESYLALRRLKQS